MKLSDCKVEGHPHYLSLAKFMGSRIVDIYVMPSKEFSDPVLEMTYVIFEDGTKFEVGGEHDIAYLMGETERYNDEILEDLYEEWAL